MSGQLLSPAVPTSPWNVLVGAWLGYTRKMRKMSASQMALAFGPNLTGPYLRSIEAGTNALPSSAAPGLVAGYDLSFEAACKLVSSVRLLDERYPRKEKPNRPYDLIRISEQVSLLRQLWPSISEVLDWLDRQISLLKISQNPKLDIVAIRASARTHVRVLDRSLRQGPNQIARHLTAAPYGLSPLIEDAVDQFLRTISHMSPQLNQEQVRAWEKDNRSRIRAVWSIVSESAGILPSLKKLDWTFFLNQHEPFLRMAIPDDNEKANSICDQFRKKLEAEFVRKGSLTRPKINVKISSYAHIKEDVERLLLFDNTRQSIVTDPIGGIIKAGSDGRYVRLRNCWIYELARGDGKSSSIVGMMDNYSTSEPRFFCAALSPGDIKLWKAVLERLDG